MPSARWCTGNSVRSRGIEEHGRTDGDAAVVGPVQAGDQIDQRRLARAARAEECRQTGERQVEIAAKVELLQPLRGRDLQPIAPAPFTRGP